MKARRPCVFCGELYLPTQEHRNYARRFCSATCAGRYRSDRVRQGWPPEDEVRRLYVDEGLTDRELGAHYGHSYQWALTVRKAYGIAGRTGRGSRRAARPRVQSNGYVKLGDEWEHRVVMAQKIGRPLAKGETVHHLDGDPQNNDPANLVLYASLSEHLWDERGRFTKRSKSKRRNWTKPREKVEAEGRCRVCARTGIKIDAAHLIPRSRVGPGEGEHPDNIVPLCQESCHPAFDLYGLDLLPFLTLGEQAYAAGLVGLVEAYQRLTNGRPA